MSTRNNYELQFLESATNLTDVLKQSIGRTPSTKISSDIAACIQQGRMFFDAAENSPLQIRPLQLYYGVVAFAKAITLARTFVAIDTLAAAHGVSDISPQNSSIDNLTLKVQSKGTFQEFNDAIAPLGGVRVYETSNARWVSTPFDASANMDGALISIVDLMARMPGLDKIFEKTFQREALTNNLDFLFDSGGSVDLRIWRRSKISGRNDLISVVKCLRNNFPFLSKWHFVSLEHQWNQSLLTFTNEKRDGDDLSETVLREENGSFSRIAPMSRNDQLRFEDIISPLAGGLLSGHPVAIAPFNGVYLPEQSLQFCACFLLSALVRYRPQTWQFAISRSRLENTPSDDRALALIQKFMEKVMSDYPQTLVSIIEGKKGSPRL